MGFKQDAKSTVSVKNKSKSKAAKVQDHRLDARVSPEVKERIRYAAELQGRSMTDFMVSTLVEAANRTIEEHHILRLSLEASQVFAEALLEPTGPNQALIKAAKRWTKTR